MELKWMTVIAAGGGPSRGWNEFCNKFTWKHPRTKKWWFILIDEVQDELEGHKFHPPLQKKRTGTVLSGKSLPTLLVGEWFVMFWCFPGSRGWLTTTRILERVVPYTCLVDPSCLLCDKWEMIRYDSWAPLAGYMKRTTLQHQERGVFPKMHWAEESDTPQRKAIPWPSWPENYILTTAMRLCAIHARTIEIYHGKGKSTSWEYCIWDCDCPEIVMILNRWKKKHIIWKPHIPQTWCTWYCHIRCPGRIHQAVAPPQPLRPPRTSRDGRRGPRPNHNDPMEEEKLQLKLEMPR